MCETVAPSMLHLNEKALHHLSMVLILSSRLPDNLKRQSSSEIVILTNMEPVKWMKEHQIAIIGMYLFLPNSFWKSIHFV